MLSATTALILAGGLGTRLRSVVADVPKVLAPVHGRPFLAWLLDRLAEAGLRHIVLCTGYRGELVEAAFGERYRTLTLEYSQESEPLGTGGGLRLALPRARSQTVLALNGDSFCDADLNAFCAWHMAREFCGSLMLTEVPDTARYGGVDVARGGRIRSFREKSAAAGRGTINAGVYLLDAHLLAEAPFGRAVSLERDLLPSWIALGLGGYSSPGAFLDIGTPESFREAERFFQPALADRIQTRRRSPAIQN